MLAACSPETTTNLDPPAPPGSAQPNLATTADGALVLSYLVDQHLQTTTLDGNTWSPPTTITHGEDILVNWADFPSVLPLRSLLWAAHWLRRRPGGNFAYDAEIAWSNDAGRTWSAPRTLHDDRTPTEHGFVSLYPAGHTLGALWLDGRAYADGEGTTQLMHRTSRSDGTFSNEQVLDSRVCDCCQTDSAVTTDGPVVVYRNRTTDEIRDIYITRLQAGSWSEGQPVADDGWRIPGCPVNGPAIDAHGRTAAVAWFTGHPTPRVWAAMSTDSGVSFNPPITISEQQVVGRVDVVLLNDQDAVIIWLEDNPGRLLTRRISHDGRLGAKVTIAHLAIERNAGFPRATLVNGALAVAWTDVSEVLSQVRVSTLELPAF